MATYNSIAKYDLAKRRTVPRRPKGLGPGPGWEPVIELEVREGFLANYVAHLSVAAFIGAVAIVIGIGLASAGTLVGFWVAISSLIAVVAGVAMPLFWYARFRSMTLA